MKTIAMKLKKGYILMLCLLLFSCEKTPVAEHDIPYAIEEIITHQPTEYTIAVDEYQCGRDSVYIIDVSQDGLTYMYDVSGYMIGYRIVGFVTAYYGRFDTEEWKQAAFLRHIFKDYQWLI